MTALGGAEMSSFLLEAFAARLLERAKAAGVSEEPSKEQIGQMARYYTLLRRWNAKVNLTALRLDELPLEPTVDRLFTESMVAARFVATAPAAWADFGSGGGSPAIPLKILRPSGR